MPALAGLLGAATAVQTGAPPPTLTALNGCSTPHIDSHSSLVRFADVALRLLLLLPACCAIVLPACCAFRRPLLFAMPAA